MEDLRSDEALIQAYLAGENSALPDRQAGFDQVVNRYQERLISNCSPSPEFFS